MPRRAKISRQSGDDSVAQAEPVIEIDQNEAQRANAGQQLTENGGGTFSI